MKYGSNKKQNCAADDDADNETEKGRKVSGLLGMMEESFFRGVVRKVCVSVGREGLKFFVRYMEVLVS
jgi:hypothetical protein